MSLHNPHLFVFLINDIRLVSDHLSIPDAVSEEVTWD